MSVDKMRLLILLAVLVAAAVAKTSYEGFKVYDITPVNTAHENVLKQLSSRKGFDFWSRSLRKVGFTNTLMVSPEVHDSFLALMTLYNIPNKMIISNVETTIQLEALRQRLAPKALQGKITFDSYHSHTEINDYVRQIGADYPELVTLETIGTSYQGREMIALTICSGTCGQNPGILIEGGIHAREWISPALVTYIIQELVENPANNAMVQSLDWYILPVHNPDGYEYTRTNDRMWRKNRKPGSSCVGTDLNRNFDYFWMYDGASDNECSEIFAGSAPFSEPETRAFSNWALANSANIKLFLAMHSYGQWLLYPWGYATILPDNAQELQDLGDAVNDAIYAVDGTWYDVGNSAILLYPAAGASDDWCKGVAGIQLSYTVELPGGGSQGFDLPPSRIQPVVRETWEGIKVFANYVAAKYAKH